VRRRVTNLYHSIGARQRHSYTTQSNPLIIQDLNVGYSNVTYRALHLYYQLVRQSFDKQGKELSMTRDYQDSGIESTISEANEALKRAIDTTPVKERPLYRSWIRYENSQYQLVGTGRHGFAWYWMLK